jgi:hypothetical protein
VSAGQASSTAVGSRMDPVSALQHALYRSAKADLGRRFHALRDKVYRRDVLWRAWVAVRRNAGAPEQRAGRLLHLAQRRKLVAARQSNHSDLLQ